MTKRTEENAKNGMFFYKEWKRTERSFIKNRKERKERNVLYKERKRMERTECSFEKNGCPTLILGLQTKFSEAL